MTETHASQTPRGHETPGLLDRFTHHPPANADVVRLHERVREGFTELAFLVDSLLPAGREKALVFTKIEEAMFWANAGVARKLSAPVTKGAAEDYPRERDQT